MVFFEQFKEHFDIRPGCTAIIGGGGKTTLMLYLCRQLSALGSVLVATSTHIVKPDRVPFTEILHHPLQPYSCMAIGTPCENDKLSVPIQDYNLLQAYADYILIEADGARQLPLKAHASHEPVIPSCCHTVLAVIGIDGIGCRIESVAHRPELYARFAGVKPSTIVTPKIAAKVISGYPNITGVIINKADTVQRLCAARELASLLPYPSAVTVLQSNEVTELWRDGKCLLS